ncbi:hypothetical protein BV22DRAFT_1125016 [Leucogyrophana mollusca]|uniref:Uncharacterized protein n=1 Tax=Leucogyrophana mollusca TaxID=85980 RepID=A0ACB8BXA3_9AGAM|nr:hypothetical protein BV22DRAFT_1125016 [Leucogyrophana mollusca]
MGALSVLRVIVFSIAILDALAMAIISGLRLDPFGLAAGGFTLLTLPAMYIYGLTRHARVTSMIVFELVVTTLIWALWLVDAVFNTMYAQSDDGYYGCDWSECSLYDASAAFAHIGWFVPLVYSLTLLITAIGSSIRGQGVWTRSVKEVSNAPAPATYPLGPPTWGYAYNGYNVPYPMPTYPQYAANGYLVGGPTPNMSPQQLASPKGEIPPQAGASPYPIHGYYNAPYPMSPYPAYPGAGYPGYPMPPPNMFPAQPVPQNAPAPPVTNPDVTANATPDEGGPRQPIGNLQQERSDKNTQPQIEPLDLGPSASNLSATHT